jgi:alpha-beta hydrolase superfamily lysophospholipase
MSEWIDQVAWVSDKFTPKPIRGVVLGFHGLGTTGLRERPELPKELEWVRAGALMVYPYYGPWSWMNRQARAFVDELVAAVYKEYRLEDSLPLVATGGSMGGCSALLYTRYARKPVAACEAIVPVCDTAHHFTERPDLPRTFRHAFLSYPEPLEALLAEHSPLAQVRAMPDIPYLLVQGDRDKAVNKERHSDRFVAAMRALNRRVEYLEVAGADHGGPFPLAVMRREAEFVIEQLAAR